MSALCSCDCGTYCPLGRMGMEEKCTADELLAALKKEATIDQIRDILSVVIAEVKPEIIHDPNPPE
jgi:hypothetical protein